MNRLFLIGRTCKDVDVSTTSSGISVGKFSLAVDRKYSKEKEADFFNITTFRTTAENCGKYLSKGSKVAIVGSIQNRTYDDKDGVKRYVTEIVADEVEFLSPKQEQGEIPQSKAEAELKPVTDDDLPF